MSGQDMRIAQLEHEVANMKRMYAAKQQLIWNLLVRVSNCEVMAGIQPDGLGFPGSCMEQVSMDDLSPSSQFGLSEPIRQSLAD